MEVSTKKPVNALPLDSSLFAAGERVCVAVSGGADSTALLRALLSRREELGIVLSVLHVEHGLRGTAAARDAAFVAALAEEFGLPCEIVAVDTQRRAADRKESIEEAARNLRYGAFREVLESGRADKIATAHTLDDQAETVLMKLLRGAWTEGLSGIHPVLRLQEASGGEARVCVRPLLAARRTQIEAYLRALGQPWCEDATNQSFAHTRNRVRHQLLPVLREYNPRIEQMLAHMAANARAEEQHWQGELARLLPQLLLPGKPARGGGRSVATAHGAAAVGLDVARLQPLDAGLRRRILRAAAEQCGAELDFDATERLLAMVDSGNSAGRPPRPAKKLELPGGVRVGRSARELQFEQRPPDKQAGRPVGAASKPLPERQLPVYHLPVPGAMEAPAFGARYTVALSHPFIRSGETRQAAAPWPAACIRAWRPGDRVELRHSRGRKKVKDVLERMGIRGEERKCWPVVVWRGKIVWMRGVELAPTPPSNDADGKRDAHIGQIFQVREERIVSEGPQDGGNFPLEKGQE